MNVDTLREPYNALRTQVENPDALVAESLKELWYGG